MPATLQSPFVVQCLTLRRGRSLSLYQKTFIKSVVQTKASPYTDNHLGGPLKLDFIETRLEPPQQLLELDAGVKFTRNKIQKKRQYTD